MKLSKVLNNHLTYGQQVIGLADQEGNDPFFTGEFRASATTEVLEKYNDYDVVSICASNSLEPEFSERNVLIIGLDLTVDDDECPYCGRVSHE